MRGGGHIQDATDAGFSSCFLASSSLKLVVDTASSQVLLCNIIPYCSRVLTIAELALTRPGAERL